MESLVIVVIVIIFAAIGTIRMEHKHRAVSLTTEADEAMRSLRGVARKRAARHSNSIPLLNATEMQDTAPIDIGTGKVVTREERLRRAAMADGYKPNGSRKRSQH